MGQVSRVLLLQLCLLWRGDGHLVACCDYNLDVICLPMYGAYLALSLRLVVECLLQWILLLL